MRSIRNSLALAVETAEASFNARNYYKVCPLWVGMNLPTFDGHLVKGILAPMEVFHEP